jgi:serine/threonine-protein kinase
MTVRYGRYEVVHKLGEGAMAAVHLGRDPVLMRFVAVKVLHPGVAASKVALQRFCNEARAVARIRSPHVVDVYDFGREGKDHYLVMEFVDGLSLQGVLKQLGATGLPEVLTASLICQAAEGLDMAARLGVVHRDIKPENLMIDSQGCLKIADFGIAHLQDESLTRTGAVLGSPLYMSPEQVRGAKPITSQSDMFSLGAVLYRCLAGAPPFSSRNLKDLYRKIAAEPHIPLLRVRPDLDPALARLVDTLLRKDPAGRGEGPRWLRSRLRSWLLSRGIDDAPELVAEHLRRLSERGIQTTWRLEATDPIPRTVAATAPATVMAGWPAERESASRQEFRPDPFPLDRSQPDGTRPGAPGRRSGLTLAFAALLPFVLAGGILSYLAYLKSGTTQSPASAGAASAPFHGLARGPASQSLAGPDLPASPGYASAADGNRPGDASRERKSHNANVREEAEGTPDASRLRAPASDPGPDSLPDPMPSDAGEPGPAKASLVIHSSPPFAEIYLDGRSLGVAPVTVPELAVGTHRLLAKSRLGRPVDTLIQVQPGRRLVRIRLDGGRIALDAAEME